MIGFDLIAATSNVTRSSFDTRFIFQNLGGFGSELRTDARLGFQTQLSTEYYRLLTYNGLFIQPHAGIDREPVYLWENQRRDIGVVRTTSWRWYRFRPDLQPAFSVVGAMGNADDTLELEVRRNRQHTCLRNGPERDTALQLRQCSGEYYLPWRLARFDAIAEAQFDPTVASENAPMVRLNIAKSFTFGDRNILAFRTEMNSYFRRNVADPLRFTLGGPLRLSASSIDTNTVTEQINYLVRAMYLRQIAALPVGIIQRIYAATGYEAGRGLVAGTTRYFSVRMECWEWE